jgi:hypothetical protein
MARISTYDKDQVIQGTDKVIGTDGITGETLNYEIADLALTISGEITYIENVTQSTDVWNLEHNLGRFPAVQVVDTAGSVVIGDIQYVDQNNITITFSAPFQGTAYLN